MTARQGLGKALSLKQFLQRLESLKLYRDILRATYTMDADSRGFLQDQARLEFKAQKDETDAREIRLLQAHGRQRLEETLGMMKMAQGLGGRSSQDQPSCEKPHE
eukprot:m.22388 g.22388  ORF g.22388 m.22388 type:complete len:105 (-) comp11244_c0_seq1:381-695(-)